MWFSRTLKTMPQLELTLSMLSLYTTWHYYHSTILDTSSQSCIIEAEWRIHALTNQPSLVQIVACLLAGVKPLSEPMLEINWTNFSGIVMEIIAFSLKKIRLRLCGLWNGGHFVSASMWYYIASSWSVTCRRRSTQTFYIRTRWCQADLSRHWGRMNAKIATKQCTVLS